MSDRAGLALRAHYFQNALKECEATSDAHQAATRRLDISHAGLVDAMHRANISQFVADGIHYRLATVAGWTRVKHEPINAQQDAREEYNP